MIKKINHIAIAVNSIDDAIKLYTDVLGLQVQGIEILEKDKVRTAIIPLSESKIELLESTDPEGPVAKHIEKRGEGLHHVALEVEDIDDALKMLKNKGVLLVDEQARGGVENSRIAFLHPKATKFLLEIVEPGGINGSI